MVRSARKQNTDAKTEQWLDDKGLRYEFYQEFDLSLVDMERSLKNQARISAPLNAAQVEVYTEGMKRGETFPPVVLWESPLKAGSFIVVDGNHRVTAGIAAGVSLSAYVLPPSSSAEAVRVLTYEANTRHGLGTTKAERQQHAIFLVDNMDRTVEQAAAELNLPYQDLQRYIRGVRTDERIAQLKIPAFIWREVMPSMRLRLMTLRDDDVFRAAMEHCAKMKLNTEEVGDLIRDIRPLGTKEEQLRAIEERNTQNRSRLTEVAVGDTRGAKLARTSSGPRRSLVTASFMVNKVYSDQLLPMLENMTAEEAAQMSAELKTVGPKLDEIIAELDKKAAEGK